MFESDRNPVSWDLETTGFSYQDEITVSGFWFPGVASIIVNTNGDTLDEDRYETKAEAASGTTVEVIAAADEHDLLQKTQQVLFQRFEREYDGLVAYNGDHWRSGGFDLPFIRSACIKHQTDWVFDGLWYSDCRDVLKKRFNTDRDDENEATGLDDCYEVLVKDSEFRVDQDQQCYYNNEYDPFKSSKEAVEYYNKSEYLPVVLHNLADLHRTWELAEICREYSAIKDCNQKRL